MTPTVNEKVYRKASFLAVVLLLTGLFSMLRWIALLLCIDFFIRGFTARIDSPILRAARALNTIDRRQPKWIDAAPGIVAAKVECILCGLIAALAFSNLGNPARLLTELLVLLIGVEAFLGIRTGTHLSSLWKKLRCGLRSFSNP